VNERDERIVPDREVLSKPRAPLDLVPLRVFLLIMLIDFHCNRALYSEKDHD
jgi:hypothetical protein